LQASPADRAAGELDQAVAAVGDGNKDLERLDAAIAVAVTGGFPTTLARAYLVIEGSSAGGWAAIRDLL
jgi:3-deoxy-D-manno-octulosonate 8-phosphate phosphatase KdsC-like HAD superfamily phosphatase